MKPDFKKMAWDICDEFCIDYSAEKPILKALEQAYAAGIEEAAKTVEGAPMKHPDDMEGFTNDCFKAFCEHGGWGWPIEDGYEYSAHTLWNETPGDAFRNAWSASNNNSAKAIRALLGEK